MKVFTALSSFIATIVGVNAGLSIDSPACTKLPDQGGTVVRDPTKCVQSLNDPNAQLAAPSCEETAPGSFCWKMNEALFGYPKYGGEVTGTLYYKYLSDEEGGAVTACTPIEKVPGDDENGKGAILVVDRGGGCTFVQKVRNAEIAGFKAVLVLDNVDTKKRVFMADDGTGSSIAIPSVFVDYHQGLRIKEGLRTYGDGFIRITLRWTLPESAGGVTWSLWTSADDDEARYFKENFQQIFDRLGPTQDFTPHFFIINGYTDGCIKPRGPKTAMTVNLCGGQCIYGGLYCAEDPEHDVMNGIDGSDVVYENLRQLCIFRASAPTDPTNKIDKNAGQVKFFDYLELFAKNCKNQDETHSRDCSEKQMKAAKYTQAQIDDVRNCAGTCDDQGKPQGCKAPADDYQGADGWTRNALLEEELSQQKNDGIFTLPTIVINGRHYRGGYTCPHPPNRGTCGAFNAICEAYVDKEEPLACRDSYCWGDDCPGNCNGAFDCKGVCNGPAKVDECGVCGGDGSKCKDGNDCNPDCSGQCGGSKKIDSCSVCGGDGSACSVDVDIRHGDCKGHFDCKGTCNGAVKVDGCGVCGGDGSLCKDKSCKPDCSGKCGGSKDFDVCGVCGGDGSECVTNYAAPAGTPKGAGAGIVVVIVIVVLLVIAIVVVVVVLVVCLRKKDEDTRRYVDSVVSSYLPMEDENEQDDEETDKIPDEHVTATL